MTSGPRRAAGILLAGVFSLATVSQVACGVFHCVAPAVVSVSAPVAMPCHGEAADDGTDGSPQPAHDEDGACCLTFPVDSPAGVPAMIAPTLVAVWTAPAVTAIAADPTPLSHRDGRIFAFVETGPSVSSPAAPLALRV